MTKLSYYTGYRGTNRNYAKEFSENFSDFTHLLPLKRLEKRQPSHMGGAYGWAYIPLALDYMCLDNNLTGKLREEVDVHESMHTEWEYETRVLSKWMINKENDKYRFEIKDKNETINESDCYRFETETK